MPHPTGRAELRPFALSPSNTTKLNLSERKEVNFLFAFFHCRSSSGDGIHPDSINQGGFEKGTCLLSSQYMLQPRIVAFKKIEMG